jgi:hypothetical protein
VSLMDMSKAVTIAVVALIAAFILPAIAARGPEEIPASPTRMEILVFETERCVYCRIFRRDVVPQYETSQRARIAPIRFVEATTANHKALGLDGPITILPTVVVMREGRESGRITGYLGPEPFFHMITRVIRSTN